MKAQRGRQTRATRRALGVSMSSPENPDPQPTKFTRRSDEESICVDCMQTVRGDRYLSLEEAEDIHRDLCLQRPDSILRYMLL